MFVQLRERPAPSHFGGLERDLDRIFSGAFGFDPGRPALRNGCEVTAGADGATIRAEVPGIDPAQLTVSVDGRTLTIHGERSDPTRGDGSYQRRERRSGSIAHTLHLADDLDATGITAECVNGVLTVRVPKRAAVQPRQIEVKVS
jgi:HSP20 family protein